jgi:hypothetical protein
MSTPSSSIMFSSTSSRPIRRRSHRSKRDKIMTKSWNLLGSPLPKVTLKSKDNQVYSFCQGFNYGTFLVTSVSAATSAGTSFNVTSHFPNYSSWATVFDQYRVDEIEVWVTPYAPANGNVGLYYTAIDYDSATAISNTAIQQYGNVEMSTLLEGHYHKFRPHVALAAYSGAFTSYANTDEMWIDSSSGSVAHFGLLIASDVTTYGITVNLNLRMKVSFRNQF